MRCRVLLEPLLVVFVARLFFVSLKRSRDGLPAFYALGFFLLSYAGLLGSMWPMMVPPTISIWEAAAPASTQGFLLVGAAVLIPVILIYTGYVYWLFRGKVRANVGYH